MTSKDRIGNHGEFVFQALISRRCRKRFYFHPVFMGEKHTTTDLVVELLDAPGIQSVFYVQVKSTTLGYTRFRNDEKLRIKVGALDIERLKRLPGPAYVAGIDVNSGRGYLAGVVSGFSGPINGLSTHHPIDCHLLPSLWNEVDTYWNTNPRAVPMASTIFGL